LGLEAFSAPRDAVAGIAIAAAATPTVLRNSLLLEIMV